MKPEGFEPPTFGSGIRRATVAPWLLCRKSFFFLFFFFRVRDSNPGRLGENQVSWPTRLTRILSYINYIKQGCDRDRTGDPKICNLMLYHWATHPCLLIRYVWTEKKKKKCGKKFEPIVTGLEPATAGFEVQRAIHCATRSTMWYTA